MTVIFQLFCVDDLKQLGEEGRDDLLRIIRESLQGDEPRPAGAPGPFTLGVTNTSQLNYGDHTPPAVLEAIQKRFDEVSQQLQAPSPEAAAAPPHLDAARELYRQLLGHRTERSGVNEPEEDRILEWAISCEVNNYNFYYALLEIKQKAYRMFQRRTGQRPKGPDTLYSPFNPQHPLYDLYASLVLDDEDDAATC